MDKPAITSKQLIERLVNWQFDPEAGSHANLSSFVSLFNKRVRYYQWWDENTLDAARNNLVDLLLSQNHCIENLENKLAKAKAQVDELSTAERQSRAIHMNQTNEIAALNITLDSDKQLLLDCYEYLVNNKQEGREVFIETLGDLLVEWEMI